MAKIAKSLSGGTKWRNKSPDYRADALKAGREAGLVSLNGQSNHEYAKTNDKFRAACEAVGIKPTARQASKYRNGIGKAFKGV